MANIHNYTKVTLKDNETQQNLSAKTMAASIFFNDGESLQYKYDNNKIVDSTILQSLKIVSPTIEVAENSDNTYRLKIKDINKTIITPNLIGPQGKPGEDGEDASIEGNYQFSKNFTAGNFSPVEDGTYCIRILRSEHKLGFCPIVRNVLRYPDETATTDAELVDYCYKRLVNGDIILITNEVFAGIIYLEGNITNNG